MANQANVTSSDALEAFRARLIVFHGKAKKAVDETTEEVRRMRVWVTTDQRSHWEGERRRRVKALEQAEQELMSARITGHQETAVMTRQAAVNKMKRAVAEAEDKIRRLKGWAQNFDGRADPLVKRLEGLRQYLDTDLPKATAYLVAVRKILEDYSSGPTPQVETPTVETPASPEPGGTP